MQYLTKKIVFDKIEHSFIIKTINKLGIEEMYLTKMKTIHDKPIVNIILSEEKLKTFPLRPGKDKDPPLATSIQQSTGSSKHRN